MYIQLDSSYLIPFYNLIFDVCLIWNEIGWICSTRRCDDKNYVCQRDLIVSAKTRLQAISRPMKNTKSWIQPQTTFGTKRNKAFIDWRWSDKRNFGRTKKRVNIGIIFSFSFIKISVLNDFKTIFNRNRSCFRSYCFVFGWTNIRIGQFFFEGSDHCVAQFGTQPGFDDCSSYTPTQIWNIHPFRWCFVAWKRRENCKILFNWYIIDYIIFFIYFYKVYLGPTKNVWIISRK